MDKNGKAAVIFFSITSAILLSTTIAFYTLKENERGDKMALQKSLDDTVIRKQAAEDGLKEMEIMNVELKTNIKAQEEKMAMLVKTVDEEKAQNSDNLLKIKERESEIEKLKSRIEDERREREDLLRRLEKLNEDYLNMKFQLEVMIKTKEELEKKAKDLVEKEGVSLGTIVVTQPSK